MQPFMDPQSVALIGISRRSGPGSFNLMEIMSDFGFTGEIYPVNPNAGEILGKKAYSSVTGIKMNIDLAVITSPRKTTLDILQDCAAAGIKAAIVVNQGLVAITRKCFYDTRHRRSPSVGQKQTGAGYRARADRR